jgi:hypothetical protein
MTIPKQYRGVAFGVLLALAAAGIYFSFDPLKPIVEAEHSVVRTDAPIITALPAAKAEVLERSAPAFISSGPGDASKTVPRVAPLAEPRREPFPPPFFNMLMARYNEVRKQRSASGTRLNEFLNADPELSAVMKAKLEALSGPIRFITIARALDDPVARPILVDGWRTMIERSSADENAARELANLSRVAHRFGLEKRFTGPPKSAEEAAALYKSVEPYFQAEYERLLEKMELGGEIVRAYNENQSSEILWRTFIGGMERRGYEFDAGEPFFPLQQ